MIKRTFLVTLSLIWCLVMVGSSTGLAQNNQITFDVINGFDGYIKNDTWLPIRVVAKNFGPGVEGNIKITTYHPGETYLHPLNLPSQSEKEITLYAPYHGNRYTLQFVTTTGEILYQVEENPRTIGTSNYIIGVVSNSQSLLNFLGGLKTTYTNENVIVTHLTLVDLPDRSVALTTLDALIFNDIDTSLLSSKQHQALTEWVSLGGHLIAGGGPNAGLTIAGLTNLLPITSVNQKTLAVLVDIETLGDEPVPTQGPYIAAIPQADGRFINFYEGGDPFLVSKPHGQGKATYFALDFGLAPMNGWAGNENFWESILNPLESYPPAHARYDALRSVNDALANIEFTGIPSPSVLFFFLCSYIFTLVPLNYLVLRKLKRPDWAWITIPALILFFTLVGYIGGFRTRGGRATLQQLSLVWLASEEAVASVDTFAGLYSPIRDHYHLQFADDVLVQPTSSGGGYNGVKTTSSAPTTIQHGPQTELQNFWTDIGTISTLSAHGSSEVGGISLDLGLIRDGPEQRIMGSIINNTGYPLNDTVILVGDYGINLTTLKTGQTTVDELLQPLSTSGYDETLWFEPYYDITNMQIIANDRVLRSIFFESGTNTTPGITVLGWQGDINLSTNLSVTDHRVNENISTLIIVTGRLKGS